MKTEARLDRIFFSNMSIDRLLTFRFVVNRQAFNLSSTLMVDGSTLVVDNRAVNTTLGPISGSPGLPSIRAKCPSFCLQNDVTLYINIKIDYG